MSFIKISGSRNLNDADIAPAINGMIQENLNHELCWMAEKGADSALIISHVKSHSRYIRLEFYNYRLVDILLTKYTRVSQITCQVIIDLLGGLQKFQYFDLLIKAPTESYLKFILDMGQKHNLEIDPYFKKNMIRDIAFRACREGFSIETIERLVELGELDETYCRIDLIRSSMYSWNNTLLHDLLKKYIGPNERDNSIPILIGTAAFTGNIRCFGTVVGFLKVNKSDIAKMYFTSPDNDETSVLDYVQEVADKYGYKDFIDILDSNN